MGETTENIQAEAPEALLIETTRLALLLEVVHDKAGHRTDMQIMITPRPTDMNRGCVALAIQAPEVMLVHILPILV